MKKLLLLSVALLAAFNLMAGNEVSLDDLQKMKLDLGSALRSALALSCDDRYSNPGDLNTLVNGIGIHRDIRRGLVIVNDRAGTSISVDSDGKPINIISDEGICNFCKKIKEREKERGGVLSGFYLAAVVPWNLSDIHKGDGKVGMRHDVLYEAKCK